MISGDTRTALSPPESDILPARPLAREIFEDDSLDALYAIEDTALEDFTRGGK